MKKSSLSKYKKAPVYEEALQFKCNKSFWVYCVAMAPDFYLEERTHLKELCDILQLFYERKLVNSHGLIPEKLIIEYPPRHGKTRTLILFCTWVLGKNAKTKIITSAYNDTFATDFSKYTRNTISEERNTSEQIIYSDIFPDVKVKYGESSNHQWALDGQFFNFKSAGKGGGVTGKGGNILLIDDPVKSAKEAFNERQLESDWLWYTGTWVSRKESNALEIINHTPWSKNDIGGKLQTLYPEECYVFKKQAYDEKENRMLCETILSLKEYAILKKTMNSIIFAANYMLERVEIKGLLYNKEWKTYSKLPVDELGRELAGPARLWCDTADKGADYLCAITGRIYDQYVYITDVYYTKAGVEITEPEIARRIVSNKVRIGRFEANAGGSVIAKHIDLLLRKEYKWIGSIVMFDQTGNKRARMLAEAGTVQDRIIFPADWDQRWPDFHLDVITFKKEGTNDHDDAPDTLTQIVEEMATDIVDKQTASEMAARRRSGR